jgi:hypothetical protein
LQEKVFKALDHKNLSQRLDEGSVAGVKQCLVYFFAQAQKLSQGKKVPVGLQPLLERYVKMAAKSHSVNQRELLLFALRECAEDLIPTCNL